MSEKKAREFGEFLRELRKSKHLTLEKLAEKIGYSNPYLSQIENGKKGLPSPELLKKLAEPLGVTYAELMIKAGYIDDKAVVIDGVTVVTPEMKIRWGLEGIQDELSNLFHWWSQLIIDEDGYFSNDKIEREIAKLIEKYDLKSSDSYSNAHAFAAVPFWESVIAKEDISISERVLREFVELCKKYSRLMSNELSNRKNTPIEIILQQPNITYNGHTLTNADRELITNMLDRIYQKR